MTPSEEEELRKTLKPAVDEALATELLLKYWGLEPAKPLRQLDSYDDVNYLVTTASGVRVGAGRAWDSLTSGSSYATTFRDDQRHPPSPYPQTRNHSIASPVHPQNPQRCRV